MIVDRCIPRALPEALMKCAVGARDRLLAAMAIAGSVHDREDSAATECPAGRRTPHAGTRMLPGTSALGASKILSTIIPQPSMPFLCVLCALCG